MFPTTGKAQRLIPERRWGQTGLLLKEMVEVGGFFKTQTITDLRNIPVGVFQ
jgi:hypothetical protein